MNVLDRLNKSISNLNNNINQIFIEVIDDNEEIILDLNTAQLEQGLTSEGLFIQPEYANPDYAEYKLAIGSKAPKGTPNLKLEGDFYSGFNMEQKAELIIIDSSDNKTPDLEDKYGAEIFGLSQESRIQLKPFLLESLKIKINAQLRK